MYGDLKVRNLIWNTGSGDNTVVLSTLATQSYVTTNFAPKANPTFTGTVTVPTASASDVSTKAASTAFVDAYYATKAAPAFTGSATGVNLTLSGNLVVNGTTTTINTQTLDVEDINITLGKVSIPSDTTANNGGITLKGSTDKTFNWLNATDAWTSSEHIEIASGKAFRVNGNNVLNQTTLGSTVVSSSLTSLGTLTGLTVSGDINIDDSDVKWRDSSSNDKMHWKADESALFLKDGVKFIIGDSSDFQISHTSNENHFGATTSAETTWKQHGGALNFKYTSGGGSSVSLGGKWNPGGEWFFNYGDSKKLETTNTGINVTGSINVNGTALSTAPEITATASGAVTAGKTMIINSNGTTSPVSATKVIRSTPLFTTTTDAAVASGNGKTWSIAYDKDNNVILFTYENSSNSIQCLAGTPGTDTITWGSAITVNSDGGSSGSDVCYVGSGKFIIVYRDGDNKGRARMISVSSNTCTAGAEQTIGSSTSSIGAYLQCTYHEQQARIYIFTKESSKLRFTSTTIGSNVNGWATDWRSKTSGGSGSDGSGTYLRSDNDYTRFDLRDNNYEIGNSYSVYDPDSQRVHVMYCNDSENRMEVVSCDAMSSTGVNTAQTIFSNNPDSYTIASIGYDTVTNRGVGCYEHSNDLRARTFTWNSSNTNFDFGTELTVTASLHGMLQVMGTDSGAVGFLYSSSDDLKCRIGTLNTSNGDISLGTEGTLPGSGADNNGHPVAVTYNPNQDLIYTVTKISDAGAKYVESVSITETTTNAEGYVGIANNTASDGNAVTIRTFGSTNDNQSGLTVGSLYYIKKDGTLSTTADTPSVQAGVALSATKLLIRG